MTGYAGSAPPNPRRGRLHALASVVRGTGYVLSALAGTVIVVVDEVFTTAYLVMGIFMLVGGLLSIVSTMTGRWVWELMGLPLLVSALLALGVLTYADAVPQAGWAAIPSVALLASFGLLVGARWVDLFALARVALRAAKRGDL